MFTLSKVVFDFSSRGIDKRCEISIVSFPYSVSFACRIFVPRLGRRGNIVSSFTLSVIFFDILEFPLKFEGLS